MQDMAGVRVIGLTCSTIEAITTTCLAPRERPWHDFVGCRASGSNMPLVLFLPADKESESEFLTANCPMHPRTCCFLAFVLHGILIVYVLLLR